MQMPVDTEHYAAELRAFLIQLKLTDEEAEHILQNNHDHHSMLNDMLTCESFDGVPDDELPNFIDEFFGLNEDSHFDATTLLASYVFRVRTAIAAGMQNKGVQRLGNLVLDTASGQFHLNGHQRRLIQTLIFQFGVTVEKLRAANAAPMGVFTPPIRALITRAMPTVPALLDHVLAQLESSPAQITASRKRVRVPEAPHEPDHSALRCHESIADLDRECTTGSADGKTVSPDHEEASGYATPPPTKMSKREIFRLTCAPLKMHPQ